MQENLMENVMVLYVNGGLLCNGLTFYTNPEIKTIKTVYR